MIAASVSNTKSYVYSHYECFTDTIIMTDSNDIWFGHLYQLQVECMDATSIVPNSNKTSELQIPVKFERPGTCETTTLFSTSKFLILTSTSVKAYSDVVRKSTTSFKLSLTSVNSSITTARVTMKPTIMTSSEKKPCRRQALKIF